MSMILHTSSDRIALEYKIVSYSVPDQNGHLSPPKIGANAVYISRKSHLRVESKICGSKVKICGTKVIFFFFLIFYNIIYFVINPWK